MLRWLLFSINTLLDVRILRSHSRGQQRPFDGSFLSPSSHRTWKQTPLHGFGEPAAHNLVHDIDSAPESSAVSDILACEGLIKTIGQMMLPAAQQLPAPRKQLTMPPLLAALIF